MSSIHLEYAPLKELASFSSGGTPSKTNSAYWHGEIPWVSPKDMGGDTVSDSEDHISPEAVDGSATKIVPSATILVVVRSGILVRRLPVALTTKPVAFNQDIKAIVVDTTKCLPEFIFWWLRSNENKVLRVGVKKGATVHSLSAGFLENLSVPLLPLDEQRRIVDILNHAAGIRRLRDDAKAMAREVIPALFVDMFGDPATNPKGWLVVNMDALFSAKPNYGTMIKPSSEVGKWLDLRVANIQNGQIVLTDRKYVDLPEKDVNRHSVSDGDLLMARAIGSLDHLGKAIVAHPGEEKWAFDSHLMRIRFNTKKVSPYYIRFFLTSSGGRRMFLKRVRQSAVQFNINVGEFASIPIPLPPLSLQQEFAERVAEVEGIAGLNDKAVAAAEQLAQSLMAQVFGQG